MENPTQASHGTIHVKLSLFSVSSSSKIPLGSSLTSSASWHVVGIRVSTSNVETEESVTDSLRSMDRVKDTQSRERRILPYLPASHSGVVSL